MQIKDSKTFGEAVRDNRKQQGMTQLQLSAVTNTSQRFISSLENGNPNIQLDKALRVAWMLGLRFDTPDTKKDSK